MSDFSQFAGHVKDVTEYNAATKDGVISDAIKAAAASYTGLLQHLEHPRTLSRLRGCAPPLQEAVVAIIVGMYMTKAERLVVASGVRSDKEQVELYAQGRTKPGKIVTHLDGLKRRSNHQVAVAGPWAGLGCAVDLVFLDPKGELSWAEVYPWAYLGALAKGQGLVWGGDWPSLRDRPHVELLS